MGYGVISVKKDKIKLISLGIVKLNKYNDNYKKLKQIYERVSYLVKEYKPESCAIEAPFYGKNVQSMLKLGRAQGVAIAAALASNVDICEYSPKKIKQSITGNGNASKEQVAGMLKSIIGYKEDPTYLDATDALATAVCHYYQQKSILSQTSVTGTSKNWSDFLKNNPGRIK